MHSKQASESKWSDRLVIRAFTKTLYYSANTKGTSGKTKKQKLENSKNTQTHPNSVCLDYLFLEFIFKRCIQC